MFRLVDLHRHAAGHQARGVRHFAGEQRGHFVRLRADFQRVHVVLQRAEIRVLVRQIFGGVARQKRRGGINLARGELRFHPRLQVQQRAVLARIFRDHRHVHKIQRGQNVKMRDVRGDEVRRLREVADDAAIVGRREVVGHVLRQHRGDAVFDRAHAANPLRDVLRVQRIAPAQKRFKPAEHFARDISLGHLAVFDLHFDAEVAFNPSDRT